MNRNSRSRLASDLLTAISDHLVEDSRETSKEVEVSVEVVVPAEDVAQCAKESAYMGHLRAGLVIVATFGPRGKYPTR